MTENTPFSDEEEQPELPRHLATLVGALQGPADLGRNHDKYLSFTEGREESGGMASA
ncbi:hypothetical protein [Thermoactinospora rubra]|uniref:hypothetical protein n=1 Tax=Thermoactinospora rubra TaxID=1088767 RepID=UPI001301B335|nr:hypothetical protein [Thermoactinospora rubra]